MPGANLAINGAGDLRYVVTFAERDDVQDEYGNVTTGWVDRFTVRANITPRLGGETFSAARLQGRQPVLIHVRQSPDTRTITTDWKATNQADGTEYNIRTVTDPFMGESNRGFFLEMLAESGVAV